VAALHGGPAVSPPGGEGVLITGVYGAGKSSVAVEITYLLEQQQRPFALLDLDYFAWGGADQLPRCLVLSDAAQRDRGRGELP
jgi:signal recognition particle GTPase